MRARDGSDYEWARGHESCAARANDMRITRQRNPPHAAHQCSTPGRLNNAPLDVEAEVHHVAVLHDVVLAFQTPLAGFLGFLLAAAGDEVGIGDDLGADEAAFEVGVDYGGGLRRGG